MTIAQAFWQGVLQGMTEFLPVSSSGHLSLFQYFTGNSGSEGFFFSILLHAGTLVAVCAVFWRTLLEMAAQLVFLISDLLTGRFRAHNMTGARKMLLMLMLSLLPLFVVLPIKDWISGFSTDNDITAEGFFFILTGIMLLTASRRTKTRKQAADMTARDALVIGVAQAVATLPGISRSGSTISASLVRGLDNSYAVSYSFILGIPAVMGAIILEARDAIEQGISLPLPVMLTGLAASIIAGILSIKLVQWMVKGGKLRYFGFYTLALGIVVLIAGTFDIFTGHMLQQFLSSL